MENRKTLLALVFSATLAFPAAARGQVSRVEPEKPRWGGEITVTYDPKAPGAKLTARDDVYVIEFLYSSDGSSKENWAKMNKEEGGVFRHRLPIARDQCFVTFFFITMSGSDLGAMVGSMIYRPDEVPAEGAYAQSMTSPFVNEDYADLFTREIGLYPSNYRAYAQKWFLARHFDEENAARMINEDMEALTKQARKQETIDLLYAVAHGYSLTNEHERCRETIKKMVKLNPNSPLTLSMLNEYVDAGDTTGPDFEAMKTLLWHLFPTHPDQESVRHIIGNHSWKPGFPIATAEAVYRKWMKEESDNPEPYDNLAVAYNKQDKKLDEASALIEKAIELSLQGKLRLYFDFTGQIGDRYLAAAYQTQAQILVKLKKPAKALLSLKAAETILKSTMENNPELYMLEGQCWTALSDTSKAEAAYLEAWRQGSKDAETWLKTCYEKNHGNLTGFDEYLKKPVTASTDDSKEAPPFRVTTLDGRVIDSKELRGKVVVLNFWFTGCLPCVAEFPALNKLVEEFTGKDVVFIAMAREDEKRLKPFLQKRKFDYAIVPNAAEPTVQFGALKFPTHIIVDKKGNIASRITGGSRDIHETLRPLIERALNR
jgi:thiol-disulfide isomerase/thioredoxin